MSRKLPLDDAQRKQLFQQRLEGNDFVASNSLPHAQTTGDVSETPSNAFPAGGVLENPTRIISQNSIDFGTKSNPNPENSLMLNKVKIEIDRLTKNNEEQERHFNQLTEFTISIIKEHGVALSQLRHYEIEGKMRDTGFYNPVFSSKLQWVDGIKMMKVKSDISELTNLLEALKAKPTTSDHKQRLEQSLAEKKEELMHLESDRSDILKLISLNTSEFYPSQLLNDNRFVLLELIGRGGFGEVWKGYDFKETKYVAIKIQAQNPNWPQETVHNFAKHIAREIQILQNTNHPNVVKYIHFFYIGERVVALVMEYCEGGDLNRAIRKKTFDEKSAHQMLCQILQGLTALMNSHENSQESVIHYDLKPANILLDNSMIPKITDFGLSKITSGEHSIMLTSPGTGTIGYTAPETFTMGLLAKITSAADTWSLGIIYYEMLTGDDKFKVTVSSSASQIDIASKKISNEGKDFIKRCLEKDPSLRPSIRDLLKDVYVETFNSNKKAKKPK